MRRLFIVLLSALALASATPDADAQGGAPSPRGKMTIGLSSLGSAEAWLPWLEAGREGWLVLEPIYESLVQIDVKTGEYVPMLAERWEADEQAKTWRFFLRKGVKFQGADGGELTADDVKYSYDRYLSETSVASSKPAFLSRVERLEVAGPHELTFHLKRSDVTFLGRLAPGYFGVASKNYVEKVGEKEAALKPVGTGPYRLVDYRRQQSATFEAVPDHWRETSGFQTVLLRRVPDQAARLAMLRAGEIDVTEIPFKLKRETEAAGLQILRVPAAALYHLQLGGQVLPTRPTFDKTVPWVGDPNDPKSQENAKKVRLALNLAVDKNAIIRAIFEGEGEPGVAPFFRPGTNFVPNTIKPYPYDPKRAKELLKEAGFPNGFSRDIEMLLMPFPGRAEMADVGEVVAGFWERNLGLKVRRRPMEFATYAPNVGGPRRTAWVTWAHGYTGRPLAEPVISMETWLASDARYNSAAESLQIDEIARKIRATVDPQERAAAYRELAAFLHENVIALPVAAVPVLYAYNGKVLKEWPMMAGEPYISGYERAVPVGR